MYGLNFISSSEKFQQKKRRLHNMIQILLFVIRLQLKRIFNRLFNFYHKMIYIETLNFWFEFDLKL